MLTIWKQYGYKIGHYRSTNNLGRLADIIWKLQPTSVEDWWIKYTTSCSGRSENQIMAIAEQISNEINVPIEKCYEDLKSIICQTYNGYLSEKTIIERLNQKHKAEKASAELDAKGIDIIVDDEYYIQVKPSNFFCGDGRSNIQLLNDRLKLLQQQQQYGDKFFVVVYKSQEYDNYCPVAYRVNNLLYADGSSKNVEFKFIK